LKSLLERPFKLRVVAALDAGRIKIVSEFDRKVATARGTDVLYGCGHFIQIRADVASITKSYEAHTGRGRALKAARGIGAQTVLEFLRGAFPKALRFEIRDVRGISGRRKADA
jgi:hypothetical protein